MMMSIPTSAFNTVLTATLTFAIVCAFVVVNDAAAQSRPGDVSGYTFPENPDDHWAADFYVQGVYGVDPRLFNMRLIASLVPDGNGGVYAAGGLETAGDVEVGRIAHWDGSQWLPLGEGVTGTVHDMVLDPSGDLYVGGSIGRVGGTITSNLGWWDGEQWHAMMDTPLMPRALALDANGDILIGGQGLARWDGEEWTSIVTMNTNIYDIAVASDGDIYVTGDFISIGGVPANGVARYDGESWHNLGRGLHVFGSQGYALVLDDEDNLYLGGRFQLIGETVAQNIAMWDGESWSDLGGAGLSVVVSAVAIDPGGGLVVGGSGYVENTNPIADGLARWDGTSWSAIGPGQVDGTVSAVTFVGNDMVIGGGFASVGAHQGPHSALANIALWDGERWHPVDHRPPSARPDGVIVRGLITTDGQILVVGTFNLDEDSTTTIMRMTEDGWESIDYPYDDPLFDFIAGPDGSVYAFGNTPGGAGEVPRPIVTQWDGVQWHDLADGLPGALWASRNAVAADGTVVVLSDGLRMMPQGGAWELIPGSFDGAVTAVAVRPTGEVIVGGAFGSIDGEAIGGLAEWTGDGWEEIGGGIADGTPTSISVHPDGDLYLSGGALVIEGLGQSRQIARWDGSEWSALGLEAGSGITGPQFAFDSSGLVFTRGGVNDGILAIYDGERWHRIGAGGDAGLSSIAIHDDRIWAFGSFTSIASGVQSGGIARWDGLLLPSTSANTSDPLHAFLLEGTYPNPFSQSATVRFTLPQAATVTAEVYDILGRRIAMLSPGEDFAAGENEIAWDAAGAASGVYLVRVSTGGMSRTARMVVVR